MLRTCVCLRVYYAHRDVGLLHSEGRVRAGRGRVVLGGCVLGLRLDVDSGVHGRGAGGGVAVRVVNNVLPVRHDVRVYEQRLQVLDVGAGQLERVDLGELSRGRVGRYQLAELIEGRVDRVHPLAFSLVGRRPLPLVLIRLHLGLGLAVLVAALVWGGAARTPAAGAPVVRLVAMLSQCRLVPTLAVGGCRPLLLLLLLRRGARFGVVVVSVAGVGRRCCCSCSRRREAGAFSVGSWGREAHGRVAQTLHRRAHAHDCFGGVGETRRWRREVCLLP